MYKSYLSYSAVSTFLCQSVPSVCIYLSFAGHSRFIYDPLLFILSIFQSTFVNVTQANFSNRMDIKLMLKFSASWKDRKSDKVKVAIIINHVYRQQTAMQTPFGKNK